MNPQSMKKFYKIQLKINSYTRHMAVSMCPYVRNYYRHLIKNDMDLIIKMLKNEEIKNSKNTRQSEEQREFTLKELSKYDGSKENPAYIAISGIVYDVSLSPVWGGGTHFGLYAGKDLTNQFESCHKSDKKILEKLPKVGLIKSS